MKTYLLYLPKLFLLCIWMWSCEKDQNTHPLVGNWIRHSFSYEGGSKLEKLNFYDDGTGEITMEMTQYCVDDISVFNGIVITNCTSFHYEGGHYNEISNFDWETEGNLLTRIYENEQEGVINSVTSTETTETLLLDLEEDTVFIFKDTFTIKGDVLFLGNPSPSNNNLLFTSGYSKLDTLRYTREF